METCSRTLLRFRLRAGRLLNAADAAHEAGDVARAARLYLAAARELHAGCRAAAAGLDWAHPSYSDVGALGADIAMAERLMDIGGECLLAALPAEGNA